MNVIAMEELNTIRDQVRYYKPDLLEEQEFQEWLGLLQTMPRQHKPEQWHKLYRLFEQWVEEQLAPYKQDPLYADLAPELLWANGIHLGQTENQEVFVPPLWLGSNLFLVGQTNSGKTNTLLHIISQLREHGIHTWIFDFQNEYGQALAKYGFTTIPLSRLRLNPLHMFEPSDPMKNLTAFQRIFGHSQGLWDASQAFLGKQIHWLYEQFGSFQGQAYPTLHDVHQCVAQAKVRPEEDRRYRTPTQNRLDDLLLLHGEIFDCQKGFSVEAMVQEDLIFDLRGVKPYTASFIAECLMAMLYEYWAVQGPQRQLHNVLVSDEAKHLFSIRQQERLPDTNPYVDEVIAETRKYGIGLILADQQHTEITNAVAANSLVKLIMQLGSGQDINRIVADAGLTEEQHQAAYRLRQGEAICKITGQAPFWVRFPRFG